VDGARLNAPCTRDGVESACIMAWCARGSADVEHETDDPDVRRDDRHRSHHRQI
jgi:hypothetical protein